VLAQEGNRALRMGEIERIPLAVSHYGEADLAGSILRWEAVRGQTVLDQGSLPLAEVKYGELTPAGGAAVNLPPADQGYQLDLRVTLEKSGQVVNTNHWSFWAFAEVGLEVPALARPENAGSIIGSGVFLRLDPAGAAPIPVTHPKR
jgi:predicted aconitase with swiveling domain